MSYCVNCGVELGRSEKSCPLCGTPVVNPASPFDESAPRPYPKHIERINARIDRRYAAAFTSVLLLIPLFVTLFTDLLVSGRFSWSLYVVGGLALVFTFVLLPLLMKSPRPMLSIVIDGLAVTAFLAAVNHSVAGSWFLPLGLPLSVLATCYAIVIHILFVRKTELEALKKIAYLLIASGVFVVGVEFFVDLCRKKQLIPTWSFYALFPCLVLACCLLILNRKAKLKDEIRRRFFI